MRRKLIVLALATIAGGLVLIMISELAPAPTEEAELAELRADVSALRGEVRRRNAPASYVERVGAKDRADHEPAPRDAAAVGEASLEGQAAEPAAMTFERSQAQVRDAFAEESVDAQWSGAATGQLTSLLHGRLPSGSQLGAIQCRTTMCQIEVRHADAETAQTFLMKGFRGWPGSLFVASDREDQGQRAMTIIASREGHEPPLGPR
jgi:hypothetical protein